MSRALHAAIARRQRGVVLPIVLVLLVVLTSLVLMQIRRGTIDQQLSINSRTYTLVETSAQSVLRWCEARGMSAANNTALEGVTVIPPTAGAAAWTVGTNWDTKGAGGNAETFDVGVAFPGVAEFRCIYEDATSELEVASTKSAANGGGSEEIAGIASTTDAATAGIATTNASCSSGGAGCGPTFCPQSMGNLQPFCKYRVTVRVRPDTVATDQACKDTPRRCLFMQSELRFLY